MAEERGVDTLCALGCPGCSTDRREARRGAGGVLVVCTEALRYENEDLLCEDIVVHPLVSREESCRLVHDPIMTFDRPAFLIALVLKGCPPRAGWISTVV